MRGGNSPVLWETIQNWGWFSELEKETSGQCKQTHGKEQGLPKQASEVVPYVEQHVQSVFGTALKCTAETHGNTLGREPGYLQQA